MRTSIPVLMWVTDRKRSALPLAEIARLVVPEGVNAIHVREKDLDERELRKLVYVLVEIAGEEAAVIVNSAAEVARDLGIGLHLPEVEPAPDGFRPLLLGRSVHTPESAKLADCEDYLIAGHIFETGSKPALPPIGPAGLERIVSSTRLPVLAIGGLTPENAGLALQAGAKGLAVMSGIGSAADPRAAAAAYRAAIDHFRAHAR